MFRWGPSFQLGRPLECEFWVMGRGADGFLPWWLCQVPLNPGGGALNPQYPSGRDIPEDLLTAFCPAAGFESVRYGLGFLVQVGSSSCARTRTGFSVGRSP